MHADINEVTLPDGHISIAFRCKGCKIVEFMKAYEKTIEKIKDVNNSNTTCGKGFQSILEDNRWSYYCKRYLTV